MTDREYTTIYVPVETRERIAEAHKTMADHPQALPLYATIEAGLNALLEDSESEHPDS